LDSPTQNTHGESIQGIFWRGGLAKESGPDRFARPAISKLPLKAPPCPFSVQPGGKTDAKNPQVNR
jgi:hypothetical protein